MKKSTYSLNMLSLLLVFVISGNSMAQETSLKKQDLKTKAKVTSFFSAYLSGKEKVCEDKATLKLSDVKKMQNIVWEAWKDANNNFTEEKLIDLEKLDNTKSGKWTLPAELEPNAIMPYYWGFKG